MRGLLIAVGIALAMWLFAVMVLVLNGRRSQARELATLIPNLLVLFRGLLRDPRVPRSAKLWLWLAVVWIASPIDLIRSSSRSPGHRTTRSWRRLCSVTCLGERIGASCSSTGGATRQRSRRSFLGEWHASPATDRSLRDELRGEARRRPCNFWMQN
jgi:hypothetical protein